MAPVPVDVDVDVLVVGAGPVGLNLAYQLRRFSSPPICDAATEGPISVHLIEAHPKKVQESFGRAVTFWPRSMEMLSQLELSESIVQQCVAVRSSAAYDQQGNEVFGRGWSFLEGIKDTRFNFASVLRQKYVEDIFRAKLLDFGVEVHERCKFMSCTVNEDVPVGEKGRVTAQIVDSSLGEGNESTYTVHCRYLVGCDGTRTLVRDAAGIETDGDRTEDKWVRVDGVLKSTTMPKPRAYGALESSTYGNVLWIPLDHGATRIGFAISEERRKLYPEMNHDMFIREVKKAVAPFEIEYDRIDWASVYSVGQRVARSFRAKESIFIAGDAAHSHSSGAGQGMNAGLQDAVNLGWKLALVLMGRLNRRVLDTYDSERRPWAETLIRYDQDISVLISGRLPKSWTGDPKEDPNVALSKVFEEAQGFNTGLTLRYDPSMLVHDEARGEWPVQTIPAPAVGGLRAPDVQVLLPALWERVWLHTLMNNVARFHVVTFSGRTKGAHEAFVDFKRRILAGASSGMRESASKPLTNGNSAGSCSPMPYTPCRPWPVSHITLLPQKVGNPWFELGTDPLGKAYYDVDDGQAYSRYDVDPQVGAVFVLRPDGWIGARLSLSPDSATVIEKYFARLFSS